MTKVTAMKTTRAIMMVIMTTSVSTYNTMITEEGDDVTINITIKHQTKKKKKKEKKKRKE